MNVGLCAEPFTKRQHRQSRIDGNCDIDDIPRPLLEIHSPAVQLHIEREACGAPAENRQPHFGSLAQFAIVPLTGCFQASLPAYRQMIAFGCDDDLGRLVFAFVDAFQRRLHAVTRFARDRVSCVAAC